MSPYKNFLNAVRTYFNTVPFLRFLLTADIFVFGVGGLLYLIGAFILGVYEVFTILGTILMYAGLLLTIIRENIMPLLITSCVISLGSLIAWIIALVGTRVYGFAVGGVFMFGPLFFFLMFGAIAIIVLVKAEKFKQMRAASAARAQAAGVPCPRCGAFIPANAGFCPSCGAPNQGPYAPQMPPQAAPMQPPPAQAPPQAAPVEPPVQPASSKCVQCGTELSPGATFCGKCGAKQ